MHLKGKHSAYFTVGRRIFLSGHGTASFQRTRRHHHASLWELHLLGLWVEYYMLICVPCAK